MGRKKIAPEKRRQITCVRLKPDMVRRLEELSEKKVMSVSALIEMCLNTTKNINTDTMNPIWDIKYRVCIAYKNYVDDCINGDIPMELYYLPSLWCEDTLEEAYKVIDGLTQDDVIDCMAGTEGAANDTFAVVIVPAIDEEVTGTGLENFKHIDCGYSGCGFYWDFSTRDYIYVKDIVVTNFEEISEAQEAANVEESRKIYEALSDKDNATSDDNYDDIPF